MNNKRISISLDETAMLFSMAGMADKAAVLMLNTYGELSDDVFDQKLDTAGHSLFARHYLAFNEENKFDVHPEILTLLEPLKSYNRNFQIVIRETPETNYSFYNIYFSGERFLSMKTGNPYVYEFEDGLTSDFSKFFIDKLGDKTYFDRQKGKPDTAVSLSLDQINDMMGEDLQGIVEKLVDLEVPDDLIEAFGLNISIPLQMTNLMYTGFKANQPVENWKPEEVGTGFMILDGPENSLLFTYNPKDKNMGFLSFLTEDKFDQALDACFAAED